MLRIAESVKCGSVPEPLTIRSLHKWLITCGLAILTTLIPLASPGSEQKEEKFDLLVYGATPSGIAAAVSAARMGIKVALVDESGRLSAESFFNDPTNSFRLKQPFYKEIWGRNSHPILDSSKFWTERGLSLAEQLINHESTLRFFEGWKWDGQQLRKNGNNSESLHLVRIRNQKRGKQISAQIFIDATQKGELARQLGVKFAQPEGFSYLDPEAELYNNVFAQHYPRVLGHHLLTESELHIEARKSIPDKRTIGMAQLHPGKSIGDSSEPFCIPYGVMVPLNTVHVLVTQCLSATWSLFWNLQPVPAQFTLGQAAGVGAALSIRLKISPEKLPVDSIQAHLIRQKNTLVSVSDVSADHPDFEWVQKIAIQGWLPGNVAKLEEPISAEDQTLISALSGFTKKEIEEITASLPDRKTALNVLWKAYLKEKWRNDPKANPKQLKD